MKLKFLLASAALCVASAAQADTVVITADRMLDVVAGKMVDRPQVIVTDGRIIKVAPSNQMHRLVSWGG